MVWNDCNCIFDEMNMVEALDAYDAKQPCPLCGAEYVSDEDE